MVVLMLSDLRSATVHRNGPVKEHRTALLDYRSMSENEAGSNQHTVRNRPWTDPDCLENLQEQGLSQVDMADELGCSRTTVRNWLRRHNLLTEDTPNTPPELEDREYLEMKYVEGGSTAADIADEVGCSPKTVLNWLRRHDIDVRSQSAPPELRDKSELGRLYTDLGLTISEIAESVGSHRDTVYEYLNSHGIQTRDRGPQIECRDILRDEVRLRKLHVDDGMSQSAIAKELDTTWNTVNYWLDRHGIPVQQYEYPTGEDHPRYNGGTGRWQYYGYSYQRNRPKAIKRDDDRCRRCGLHREWHREVFGRDIEVHHIVPYDPDRGHGPQNRLTNLITLCQKCHVIMQGVPIDNR